MSNKRKYYIWDDLRKEFVGDFMGCTRSSSNKSEVEEFLLDRQQYEFSLSEEEQQYWIENKMSWKYCYIMLLTPEEMFDFQDKQNKKEDFEQ